MYTTEDELSGREPFRLQQRVAGFAMCGGCYRLRYGRPPEPEDLYVTPFPDGWWFGKKKAARIGKDFSHVYY